MQHSAWDSGIRIAAAMKRYGLFRLRHNSFQAEVHLLRKG
jgi:hypothetical protein